MYAQAFKDELVNFNAKVETMTQAGYTPSSKDSAKLNSFDDQACTFTSRLLLRADEQGSDIKGKGQLRQANVWKQNQ